MRLPPRGTKPDQQVAIGHERLLGVHTSPRSGSAQGGHKLPIPTVDVQGRSAVNDGMALQWLVRGDVLRGELLACVFDRLVPEPVSPNRPWTARANKLPSGLEKGSAR
jgi:hypothetical protein